MFSDGFFMSYFINLFRHDDNDIHIGYLNEAALTYYYINKPNMVDFTPICVC